MAHVRLHPHVPHAARLPADGREAARDLETGAAALLVAYGIACGLLAFLGGAPAGLAMLGLVAVVAAGAGFRAPLLTGLVVAVAGGVIAPLVAYAAQLAGMDVSSWADGRVLAFLFALPVVAGVLQVAAAQLARRRA